MNLRVALFDVSNRRRNVESCQFRVIGGISSPTVVRYHNVSTYMKIILDEHQIYMFIHLTIRLGEALRG